MCTVTLADINELCGANVPGNISVYVANYDDLATVPSATAKVITGDITMVASATFKRFNFTEDTCQHTEEQNEGGSVDGILRMNFHKDDAIKRNQFEAMVNGKFSVIVTDGNGLTKLIRKCRWRRNYDSGTSGADVNGYSCEFFYTAQAADVYEGVIPTA